MRANTGMLKMPMAATEVTSPGPWIAVSMMAVSSAGNAKVKSAARISSSSTQPRRAAASSPAATPTPRPMPTAMRPTAMALREPTISSETMSRPRLSVPSQWLALGKSSLFGTSISVAACGVHSSESAAVASSSITSTPPMAKLRWRSALRAKLMRHPPSSAGRSPRKAGRR
jgi:hypothetical protein